MQVHELLPTVATQRLPQNNYYFSPFRFTSYGCPQECRVQDDFRYTAAPNEHINQPANVTGDFRQHRTVWHT